MAKIKMKKKHNKKRNTAFLYETLVRELTRAVLNGDNETKKKVIAICKEHFKKGTLLHKERALYNDILETRNMDREVAKELLSEAKKERAKIDDKKLFNEQTSLINKINKALNGRPFTNFIPDYKNLATVAQIFSDNTPVKERVLLENSLVEKMCSSDKEVQKENLQTIDSLTYKTFVNKFNEQYGQNLLEEQQELITRYVMSFADNGIGLKVYLNEEIGRLKEGVKKAIDDGSSFDDEYMVEKANNVINVLSEMKENRIDDSMIGTVLKVQTLVNEVGEKRDDS